VCSSDLSSKQRPCKRTIELFKTVISQRRNSAFVAVEWTKLVSWRVNAPWSQFAFLGSRPVTVPGRVLEPADDPFPVLCAIELLYPEEEEPSAFEPDPF
jgi:hypothetical protein